MTEATLEDASSVLFTDKQPKILLDGSKCDLPDETEQVSWIAGEQV